MTRAERLNTRFKTIQRTLEELYGRERAFGAATAAWLMAVQYMQLQAMRRLESIAEANLMHPNTLQDDIKEMEQEFQSTLQSFHAELCEHLKVDQVDAWDLAKSFQQVIDDVCHQGG